jgi:putative ATPase
LQADFFELSGVKSKKEDLNEILEHAEKNKAYGKKTLLFLDEIHRWNKAQQDALLPFVESGLITLIGATTENPSFTINNALLSRSKVLVFESLSEEDIVQFFEMNWETILSFVKKGRGEVVSDTNLISFPLIKEDIQLIASLSNGDLRNACNLLEAALMLSPDGMLNQDIIQKAFGKPMYYDRDGEEHYNIISAVHKSLRDSDPHAACYWIQRMLVGGEDPCYIARRLLRFASEDIGPADNNALLLANQVYDAVIKI